MSAKSEKSPSTPSLKNWEYFLERVVLVVRGQEDRFVAEGVRMHHEAGLVRVGDQRRRGGEALVGVLRHDQALVRADAVGELGDLGQFFGLGQITVRARIAFDDEIVGAGACLRTGRRSVS